MKKILQILSSLTLTTTTSASVIACNNKTIVYNGAEKIKNKIINTSLVLTGVSNPDLSDPNTIKAFKQVLQANNKALSNNDLEDITFNKIILQKNITNQVTAYIISNQASGTYRSEVFLQVVLANSNNEIRDKITHTKFMLDSSVNASTKNQATISALKATLQTFNPFLSNQDLAVISFSSVNLTNNFQVVTATIGSGSTSASVVLNVAQQLTNQALANKITQDSLGNLPMGTSANLNNLNTQYQLALLVQKANSNVYPEEFARFTWKNKNPLFPNNLVFSSTNNLVLTIVNSADDTTVGTVAVTVTLLPNNQQIAGLINDNQITVANGTNPDTSVAGTITALKNAVKTANPALATSYLDSMSFSHTTLIADQTVPVTLSIAQTGVFNTATIYLKVTLLAK